SYPPRVDERRTAAAGQLDAEHAVGCGKVADEDLLGGTRRPGGPPGKGSRYQDLRRRLVFRATLQVEQRLRPAPVVRLRLSRCRRLELITGGQPDLQRVGRGQANRVIGRIAPNQPTVPSVAQTNPIPDAIGT